MSDIRKSIENAIKSHSTPTIGSGEPHEGQAGYIIYERDGLPAVIAEIERAIGERTLKKAEPSAGEISELIEFVQDGRGERTYALAVAEKLPTLLAELDALKTERKETANAILAHMSSEADFFINYVHSVGDTLKYVSSERDRLAGDVERLRAAIAARFSPRPVTDEEVSKFAERIENKSAYEDTRDMVRDMLDAFVKARGEG